ncbi:hypothetical protein GWI33_009043 [Rhynchophorus ferrugineus]|uniref:Uncharacterized protein n=1 Tax=Rhynchophorus ferrugineus TaxID=354439 RepID=A0A834IFD0_RHYFE|nr:hypothetical protein GWI33_009043 [Rhynchophorus ferrugineus]
MYMSIEDRQTKQTTHSEAGGRAGEEGGGGEREGKRDSNEDTNRPTTEDRFSLGEAILSFVLSFFEISVITDSAAQATALLSARAARDEAREVSAARTIMAAQKYLKRLMNRENVLVKCRFRILLHRLGTAERSRSGLDLNKRRTRRLRAHSEFLMHIIRIRYFASSTAPSAILHHMVLIIQLAVGAIIVGEFVNAVGNPTKMSVVDRLRIIKTEHHGGRARRNTCFAF